MPANIITPSDLKTILHSKRANIYYLEKCRVQVNGGRVEYVTQEGKDSFYWNIPIANTTAVMLGMGTSVTQMAMREFARAGVMVGFCGTDGTPLYSGNEVDIDVSWLSPQSEYRPTTYLQNWVSFWFSGDKRLEAAKRFQFIRLQQITRHWTGVRAQRESPFQPDKVSLQNILERARQAMEDAPDHTTLMLQEAQLTKSLYKLVSQTVGYGSFTRAKRGGGADLANRFLDQGNYLAYGLAAVAAWVTGIPHGLAVMHGKTRRGGLVFDLADLIKDALVMPQAFVAAMEGEDQQMFRQRCINAFQQADALDVMINTLQETSQSLAGGVQ
ncbi:type I-F CRISPR-associated endonuclease Cas1f [Raoultella ornithinolytica]|uniref:type I-F CRISPR-associated endonuclease Cas1f n=1 Tax=Raoultella ornithinolytica TaxID=54291 RepID=UPI000F6DF1E7|nr:type I-F CRISPR-associated endonuclease Cas1f [Raoultella ornithinolytica]MEC5098275.1 type I-F CRISPR-associated endonuclease Cas1f [Raoultella ornithinolytica]MEC5107647.1 type I-F CRISPR-associated endonuclease Cas1f [Raoultella ornithinolytica]VEB71695.1 CRISPR-associated protein Cas1 [Raoultella ornithinolytica]HDH7846650.1 type I-F CRISPR-associated endonuclease Cas1 [Raoultella ornithinolytica]